MKTVVKVVVVVIIILCLVIPTLIYGLYIRNGRIGVETDFRKSVFLQNTPEILREAITLKVVTFNIQDLWIVGRNRPERMAHIARVLSALDPDLVGFQEAFIEEDRAALLKALESSRLAHHHYFPSGSGGSGLLICSAWPIQEVFFHRYSVSGPAHRIWEGDFWAGKGAALARIETPAGMVDFYNTHAQAGYGRAAYRELRRNQMAELAAFINNTKTGASPVFLVGDMNCGIGKVDYETVVNEAGLTRSMTIDSRIDHIFTGASPLYTHETLNTVKIQEQITEGDRSFRLSDHAGYMSTIHIAPVNTSRVGNSSS